MNQKDWKKQRDNMVEEQLKSRGITDDSILKAFKKVPRHKFVPSKYRKYAYDDRPLPIAKNQTISQPYIVAEMIDAMDIDQSDSVLEIGIGSGYAGAVLSRIVKRVYGVELHQKLVSEANDRFDKLGYDNIEIKQGDGTKGWEEYSPYAGIMVSAAAPEIPGALLEQLEEGGYLIIPLGQRHIQNLTRIKKVGDGYQQENMEMVRFVPLVNKEGW